MVRPESETDDDAGRRPSSRSSLRSSSVCLSVGECLCVHVCRTHSVCAARCSAPEEKDEDRVFISTRNTHFRVSDR